MKYGVLFLVFLATACEFPAGREFVKSDELQAGPAFFEIKNPNVRLFEKGNLVYEFSARKIYSDPEFRKIEVDRILIVNQRGQGEKPVNIIAEKATKKTESDWMELSKNVKVFVDETNYLRSAHMQYDLRNKVLQSENGVIGKLNGTFVNAASFQYDSKVDDLLLTEFSWQRYEKP